MTTPPNHVPEAFTLVQAFEDGGEASFGHALKGSKVSHEDLILDLVVVADMLLKIATNGWAKGHSVDEVLGAIWQGLIAGRTGEGGLEPT
jgi:hypothetical protein